MTSEPTQPIPTFDHRQFDAATLLGRKRGRSISVCLPARNEEATVGEIVGTIRRDLVAAVPLVEEILVVDDGSTDSTAEHAARAGARVISRGLPRTEPGAEPGKGQALSLAAAEAKGDIVVFLDADVREFGSHFVVGLLGPVLVSSEVAFVKGFYQRPLHGRPGEGGRVTELVARPLLARLFPHLAGVVQPLAGECAVRRDVLAATRLADGYGVELAMLIDVAREFGVTSLAQVDLGERVHRNRPLAELAPQAAAVLDVALARAGLSPADRRASGTAIAEAAIRMTGQPTFDTVGADLVGSKAADHPRVAFDDGVVVFADEPERHCKRRMLTRYLQSDATDPKEQVLTHPTRLTTGDATSPRSFAAVVGGLREHQEERSIAGKNGRGRPAALAFAAVLLAGLGGCGDEAGGDNSTTASRTDEAASGDADTMILIEDFKFSPDPFRVAPGTTVTVENADDAPHTLTARDGSFDTGTIAAGGSADVSFNGPGRMEYHCKIHPSMVGVVEVAEGTAEEQQREQPGPPPVPGY